MKLNSIFLSIAILSSIPFYAAHSEVENVCDQMIKEGTYGEEELADCVKKFGESDSYKTNLASMKNKKIVENLKNAVADGKEVKNENIEIKKFDTEDLAKAAFKRSFYAAYMKPEIFGNKFKDITLTEGDDLCKYLGFTKATGEIMLSGPIPTNEVKGNGFIVRSSGELELYTSDKYFVRRFKEINCVRGISKDTKLTKELLKKLVSYPKTVENVEILNAPKIEKANEVSDKRKKERTTDSTGSAPFSYKPERSESSDTSSK